MSEKKLTTHQVLLNKFPPNEYVLIMEVSNASGFSRSRSLDFMAINLWESRGLAVTGIERKSNRGDWLKEMKSPEKQESHFKHCDYFYLLTDKEGVAKIEEIPPTWGWYHIKGNRVMTMKQAPKLNPQPIGRSLMCAMLRRAASKESYVHKDEFDSLVEEKVKASTAIYENSNFTIKELKSLRETVAEFEKESGIKITGSLWREYPYGTKMKNIGEAVKLILNGGLEDHIKDFKRYHDIFKTISNSMDDHAQKLNKLYESKELHFNNAGINQLTNS